MVQEFKIADVQCPEIKRGQFYFVLSFSSGSTIIKLEK